MTSARSPQRTLPRIMFDGKQPNLACCILYQGAVIFSPSLCRQLLDLRSPLMPALTSPVWSPVSRVRTKHRETPGHMQVVDTLGIS